jgi:hypothetical protein
MPASAEALEQDQSPCHSQIRDKVQPDVSPVVPGPTQRAALRLTSQHRQASRRSSQSNTAIIVQGLALLHTASI